MTRRPDARILPGMTFDLDRIGGPKALARLVDEVLAAGELGLDLYRKGAGERAERKPDRSPVTEADRRIEAHLRGYLERTYPDAGFLGEESGAKEGAAGRWILDPIDGTRAFLRGIPTWSILLALEVEGVPSVGIAYMPATEELFVAVLGQGATRDGRPCRLSAVASLEDACVCHGGLVQFTDAGLEHLLPRLARETFTQRGFGDFASYRELLQGRVDAVVEPGVQPYDVAPVAVLVREAGGRLTDFEGRDTIHARDFVVSNGPLHDAMLELCRRPA